MSLTANAVISILESRYDHYSARAVYKIAAEAAGLDPKGKLEGADVGKFADALSNVGDRVEGVVQQIRDAGDGKAPAKKAAPAKKEEAKEEKAEAKADAKEEKADAKADAKEEKAEEKPAAKRTSKRSSRSKK